MPSESAMNELYEKLHRRFAGFARELTIEQRTDLDGILWALAQEEDAALIAHAPTDLAACVEALEKVKALRDANMIHFEVCSMTKLINYLNEVLAPLEQEDNR